MPPIQCLLKTEIPERLGRAFPPVKRLYTRGTLPDLTQYKCLAVVGARKFSKYGEQVCQELIGGLNGYPILIISGLAIGIDSIAHQAALDSDLITLAVPGSGLNEEVIYPASKLPLARKILSKGGCLVSEYPPDLKASPWTFPERNRIMAGLADAVLIIEAEQKSGTLITARLALDYNKEVFAVPGSIFSTLSEGPHFLISEGATPITNSKSLVEALGLIWKEKENPQQNLFAECSPEEQELLSLLLSNKTRDEISRVLNKPVHEVSSLISLLEIKGIYTQK